jgi:hypothetical protein
MTMGAEGLETTYRLGVDPLDAPYENLPAFVMKPVGDGDAFHSLPSECEL